VIELGLDNYAALLVAVLRQAVRDVRAGRREALTFLVSPGCARLVELLGLEPAALQRELQRDATPEPADACAPQQSDPGDDAWLSIPQASRLTGYHPEHLRRLARCAQVEARRIGSHIQLRWASLRAHREETRQPVGRRRRS
jgi:hypothetical protein